MSQEERARRGAEIFERKVRPLLRPEDDGKFVAIDIATEEFEVADVDWDAVMRLSARRQGAQIWLMRIGMPYRMSYRMSIAP
jgi:hypothetical protein